MPDREPPDLATDFDAGLDRGAEVEAHQDARLGVLQLGARERIPAPLRPRWCGGRRDHAEREGVPPGEPAQDLRRSAAEQAVRRRMVGQRRRRAQGQPRRIGRGRAVAVGGPFSYRRHRPPERELTLLVPADHEPVGHRHVE